MHAIADAVGSKNTLEATVSSLQAEIADSKAKCAALVAQASSTQDQNLAEDVRQLNEKLETMQSLVTQLRTLIN
jgi:F0F1-type ATP synthase membrane subunit b/b'